MAWFGLARISHRVTFVPVTSRGTSAAIGSPGVSVDAGISARHQQVGQRGCSMRFVTSVTGITPAADVEGVAVPATEPAVIFHGAGGAVVGVGIVAVTIKTKFAVRHGAGGGTGLRTFLQDIRECRSMRAANGCVIAGMTIGAGHDLIGAPAVDEGVDVDVGVLANPFDGMKRGGLGVEFQRIVRLPGRAGGPARVAGETNFILLHRRGIGCTPERITHRSRSCVCDRNARHSTQGT